jgi:hypothetical protein
MISPLKDLNTLFFDAEMIGNLIFRFILKRVIQGQKWRYCSRLFKKVEYIHKKFLLNNINSMKFEQYFWGFQLRKV